MKKFKAPFIIKCLIELSKHLKYMKDPCGKCLVKVTCKDKFDPTCPENNKHMNYIQIHKNTHDELISLGFAACLFSGIGFVILTVFFGFCKWGEIIYSYFS